MQPSYFNSRPREGADQIIVTLLSQVRNFNSRPREGADMVLFYVHQCSYISTHGPARGPTHSLVNSAPTAIHFNSRPREGADCTHFTYLSKEVVFQLTAPRGGRLETDSAKQGFHTISTHGPARGPTLSSGFLTIPHSISTHGPARGPTSSKCTQGVYVSISTHGPARGPTHLP